MYLAVASNDPELGMESRRPRAQYDAHLSTEVSERDDCVGVTYRRTADDNPHARWLTQVREQIAENSHSGPADECHSYFKRPSAGKHADQGVTP